MFHTIHLSKSNPTPLYIQLASELSSLIQHEILKNGFKLPTIRQLATQLMINRDTVVNAYKLLEQQGLVQSYIGKGTYITYYPEKELPSPIPTSSSRLCCSQLKFPTALFPTSLCLELTNKIVTEEGWEAFSDPLHRHRTLLKQTIASYFSKLGIFTHFAQIKLVSSIEEFMLSLIKAFPKTGICVEGTRDLTLSCLLQSYGAKIYEIPLSKEGIDLEALEKQLRTGTISYIIVSPYLQNPTGMCYSQNNKQALLRLAENYDCYIIEDGSYCEFLNTNEPYMPLFNLSTSKRVIYMYSFTKLYLPFLKYYFFVVPAPCLSNIKDDNISSFNERLLYHYLMSDTFKHMQNTLQATMHDYYTQLISALSKTDCPLSLTYTNGGLFLWLKPNTTSLDAYTEYLSKNQVIVAPETLFSTQQHACHFRLSLTSLTAITLNEIIEILLNYST